MSIGKAFNIGGQKLTFMNSSRKWRTRVNSIDFSWCCICWEQWTNEKLSKPATKIHKFANENINNPPRQKSCMHLNVWLRWLFTSWTISIVKSLKSVSRSIPVKSFLQIVCTHIKVIIGMFSCCIRIGMASMLHFTTTISLKKWTLCSHIKSSSMCTLLFSEEYCFLFYSEMRNQIQKQLHLWNFFSRWKKKCVHVPVILVIWFNFSKTLSWWFNLEERRSDNLPQWDIWSNCLPLDISRLRKTACALQSPLHPSKKSNHEDTTSHLICLPEAT